MPEANSALGLLALVAGQDVEQDDDGTWKIAQRVAPDRIISVVDPEARHMHKSRSEYRDGYKAHIAIEPETGLVTAAALTPANAPDGRDRGHTLADEDPGLQVLADGAYGSGGTLAALHEAGHNAAIKPFPMHVPSRGPSSRRLHRRPWRRHGDLSGRAHRRDHPKRNAHFGARCEAAHSDPVARTPKAARQFDLTADDEELVESRRAWRDGDFARTTEGGDRWWNARSHGSWRTTTDGSDSGASRGTSSVSPCASPPSISAGWSISDSITTENGGSAPS